MLYDRRMDQLAAPSPGDLFASITRYGPVELVTLPPAYAGAAVLEYLRIWGHEGRVEVTTADRWRVSVRARPCCRARPLFAGRCSLRSGFLEHDFPLHVVEVPRGKSSWLASAVEKLKPAQLDESGFPLPWVPVRHAPKVVVGAPSGAGGAEGEDDVVSLPDGEPLAPLPLPAAGPVPRGGVPDEEIVALAERLRAAAGCPPFELVIGRAEEDQHGFTAGRVWFGELFVPRRIALVVCPNADLAEVAATLLHELAHPLSRSGGHGAAFKQTLLELAGATHGAVFFEAARAALGGRQAVLDLWIATGVRASLRGDEPPRARVADDATAARVVSRIRKLRALAADQIGTPEAVAATAAANDLSTVYGFGDCEVRVERGLDDQLVDRFLRVEKGKVWKRSLAFALCDFCDVFGLSFAPQGRMHLFGRYADLVFVEHLYGVCEASIERKADAHVKEWKARLGARPSAAESRRERTSFCDTAVVGLEAGMKELRAAEHRTSAGPGAGVPLADDRQQRAERMALAESEKRGQKWGSGFGREIDFNVAGFEAGRAIQLHRAIDEVERAPLALARGRSPR